MTINLLSYNQCDNKPLNFARIFAISLLIRFSSNSLTLPVVLLEDSHDKMSIFYSML